jgi:hypothetical protein
MNKTERQELRVAINAKTKAARMTVAQRQAEMIAHVEKQLSAIYKADHELFRAINQEAERAVSQADKQIAAICQERGIPESFRPSLRVDWYGTTRAGYGWKGFARCFSPCRTRTTRRWI